MHRARFLLESMPAEESRFAKPCVVEETREDASTQARNMEVNPIILSGSSLKDTRGKIKTSMKVKVLEIGKGHRGASLIY